MSDLSTSAVLVHFRASMWNPVRIDRKESRTVTTSAGADEGRAKVQKVLLESPLLDAPRKIYNTAYTHTYRHLSLPWTIGANIMPAALRGRFESEMAQYHSQYFEKVGEFLNAYPDLVARQAQALGSLYNEADYPPVEQLASKFTFKFHYSPVPSLDDFRVALSADMRERIGEEFRQALANAHAHHIERLRTSLEAFIQSQAPEKKSIHKTIYDNLAGLLDITGSLNLVNDPKLETLCEKAKIVLSELSINDLRERNLLAQQAVTKLTPALNDLDELLETMNYAD